MSGPRFSNASFAHNRLAVGPVTGPHTSAEREAAVVTMPETPHFTALMETARDTFREGGGSC